LSGALVYKRVNLYLSSSDPLFILWIDSSFIIYCWFVEVSRLLSDHSLRSQTMLPWFRFTIRSDLMRWWCTVLVWLSTFLRKKD